MLSALGFQAARNYPQMHGCWCIDRPFGPETGRTEPGKCFPLGISHSFRDIGRHLNLQTFRRDASEPELHENAAEAVTFTLLEPSGTQDFNRFSHTDQGNCSRRNRSRMQGKDGHASWLRGVSCGQLRHCRTARYSPFPFSGSPSPAVRARQRRREQQSLLDVSDRSGIPAVRSGVTGKSPASGSWSRRNTVGWALRCPHQAGTARFPCMRWPPSASWC